MYGLLFGGADVGAVILPTTMTQPSPFPFLSFPLPFNGSPGYHPRNIFELKMLLGEFSSTFE